MKRILICIASLAMILSCEKDIQMVINEGSISGSWEITSMAWEEIVGTIAGDDTIFMLCRSEEIALVFTNKLRKMLDA